MNPAGREMQVDDWAAQLQTLGVLLVGEAIEEPDDDLKTIVGNSFFVLLNASPQPVSFEFPDRLTALVNRSLEDTARGPTGEQFTDHYDLEPHSAAVMIVTPPSPGDN